MKLRVRLGHVTNSSSTNHILMWNGAKEDLRQLLLEHAHVFPLGSSWLDDVGTITVDEIVNAFTNLAERIEPREKFLEQLHHGVEWRQKSLARSLEEIAQKKGDDRESKWLLETLKWHQEDLEGAQAELEEAQIYDWRIIVGFGDNHGDYQGGDLGYIMDYEGRYINVEEVGFRYKTEQNR